MTTPRGVRLNNPGNIRRSVVQWVGQSPVQVDPEFVEFIAPAYGFRAMVRIMRSYRGREIDTLREIVATYAPPTENNSAAYLDDLVRRTSWHPDAPIDITDPATAATLCEAITWHEQGQFPYDLATLHRGVAMGLGNAPVTPLATVRQA